MTSDRQSTEGGAPRGAPAKRLDRPDGGGLEEDHGAAAPARWGNVFLLSLAWCMAVCALFLNVSSTTVAARLYGADDVSTIPIGLFQLSSTAALPLLARCTRSMGRRRMYLIALPLGIIGAGVSVIAAEMRNIWLLTLAATLQGPAFAAATMFRFVSVDFAGPEHRDAAIGATVLGGAFGAIGPFLGSWLRNSLPNQFVGTYIVLMGFYILELGLVMRVDLESLEERPQARAAVGKDDGREVPAAGFASDAGADARTTPAELARARGDAEGIELVVRGPDGGASDGAPAPAAGDEDQEQDDAEAGDAVEKGAGAAPGAASAPAPPASAWPAVMTFGFTGATAIAALTYMSMASLMTATPLGMLAVGLRFEDTVVAIAAHLLGMYLPSLFSGRLAKLLGPPWLAAAGCAVGLLGACLYLVGTSYAVFVCAACVVGVGWNGAYVGASAVVPALIVESQSAGGMPGPAVKTLLQSVFDTTVLLGTAVISLVTGAMFQALGPTTFWYLWIVVCAATTAFAVLYAVVRARSVRAEGGK